MRKIIFPLVAVLMLVMVQLASATSVFEYSMQETPRMTPYGIKVYDLHTRNTGESKDTMLTTDVNLYGPFELCNDGDQLPTKFQVQSDATTGTNEETAVEYQLIAGKSPADTVSAWTVCDTISDTASNQEITIAGAGSSIIFRLVNFSADETQIPGRVRIIIPSASSVYRVKK